eukprot:scaffold10462_cov92-Amphora_coffeaeformis.AAC.1
MRTEKSLTIHCVPFMEQQWLQNRPNIRIPPVFAKDIGRIQGARDVHEIYKSRSNSFTDKVKTEHIVALVELGMNLG